MCAWAVGMDRYSEDSRVSEYRFVHSTNLNSITTGSIMAPLGPIGERMQSRVHTPEWLNRDFVPSPSSAERPSRRFRVDSPCRALDGMQGGYLSPRVLPMLEALSLRAPRAAEAAASLHSCERCCSTPQVGTPAR